MSQKWLITAPEKVPAAGLGSDLEQEVSRVLQDAGETPQKLNRGGRLQPHVLQTRWGSGKEAAPLH